MASPHAYEITANIPTMPCPTALRNGSLQAEGVLVDCHSLYDTVENSTTAATEGGSTAPPQAWADALLAHRTLEAIERRYYQADERMSGRLSTGQASDALTDAYCHALSAPETYGDVAMARAYTSDPAIASGLPREVELSSTGEALVYRGATQIRRSDGTSYGYRGGLERPDREAVLQKIELRVASQSDGRGALNFIDELSTEQADAILARELERAGLDREQVLGGPVGAVRERNHGGMALEQGGQSVVQEGMYESGGSNGVTPPPGSREVVNAGPNEQPRVRSATIDDVSALANIELQAYKDVYSPSTEEPSKETVLAVQEKYRERIALLGGQGLIRVLEHPDKGVYGMIVCCTTNLSTDDFLAENGFDMTRNENLRQAYDPQGRNGYIVNLAVLPRAGGIRESQLLFNDAQALGRQLGVESVYFESRIPGYTAWCERQRLAAAASGQPIPTDDILADQYWRLTRRNGEPLDPLLRRYAEIGAIPLGLIKDAWKPDRPSGGYGVLCELSLDQSVAADDAEQVSAALAEAHHTLENNGFNEDIAALEAADNLITVDGKPQGVDFFRRVGRWIKGHPVHTALYSTAAATVGYIVATGQETAIFERIKEHAPLVGGLYLGCLAVYAAGYVMMGGAGAWSALKYFKGSKQVAPEVETDHAADNKSLAYKIGYWANLGGGVSAAVVLGAGTLMTLPPEAWPASLTLLGADAASTIVTRMGWSQAAQKLRM